MQETLLIIPGVRGSGPGHWQTWFEAQLPAARRITGIEWNAPKLSDWANAIRREIGEAQGAVWLIAHSFGCLAAAHAASGNFDKVAGAMLVAPADPERFTSSGRRRQNPRQDVAEQEGLSSALPNANLGFPSVVIASESDPCANLVTSAYWADRWGSRFISIGNAGHINIDSGHGPWPEGLDIFNSLREQQGGMPLGAISKHEIVTHA